ncbi:hypothetical protein ANN_13741 [Periplaneta americana]|uniref:Uncharacterized protein n=1 Tax=Periplaneta americana TaxID=6978 RepID=A0ABQ8SUC9_PERAM|nr:hypothetical protein ANN_13741 [Periplaneta americana]
MAGLCEGGNEPPVTLKSLSKKSGRTREQRIFSKSTSGRGDVTRCMCLYKQFRNYENIPYLRFVDQR